MDTPLEMYQNAISEVPDLTEQSFNDALNRYRTGDEAAARDISGGCLRLAMGIAEKYARKYSGHDLLDLIQDANGGLFLAVTTFKGDDLQQFLRYTEEKIHE